MMLHNGAFVRAAPIAVLLAACILSCAGGAGPIVPESGYRWPDNTREDWPTDGWRTAPMEAHGIYPERMAVADEFAAKDDLTRALLVVRNGRIVFEKYYGDGGVDRATNLWSVTKSVVSCLVGIVRDQGGFDGVHQDMKNLMPRYPGFRDIRLEHVLTQTTGLRWAESGGPWSQWVFSEDWIQTALDRGFERAPGEAFKYSSGNSHFLSGLVLEMTRQTPGGFARQHLFEPLGIRYEPLGEKIEYTEWEQYMLPLPHGWRCDPAGLECAGFGLYLTAREMAKFGYLFLNRGRWDGRQIVSEAWVLESTRDQVLGVYGRYSHGYQWWITLVDGEPCFLASGWGGQIIGVVPSLDLVVVLKYEAGKPVHPVSGTAHDDMGLLEHVVRAVRR